jgi:hypothetical protein
MTEPSNPPANPRVEPEVIPPGAPLPGRHGAWTAHDIHRTHYVYTSRVVGPVGLTLLALAGGAIATLAILFLLGAAVIGFAAIGVVTIAAVLAGILRRPNHPLR